MQHCYNLHRYHRLQHAVQLLALNNGQLYHLGTVTVAVSQMSSPSNYCSENLDIDSEMVSLCCLRLFLYEKTHLDLIYPRFHRLKFGLAQYDYLMAPHSEHQLYFSRLTVKSLEIVKS